MELPRELELGPKMQACSPSERKFVWLYVTGDGNATQAAREAGYVDNGNGAIRVRAHALLHRARVQEAIRELSIGMFGNLLPTAVRAAADLLSKPDHPDHAGIVKSMLSRLGLAEKSGVDVTVAGSVQVNHTDAALDDLQKLLELGVSRERLLETFGFSGLTRYEQMLAERQRRLGGPVIDAEVVDAP
jgi:hypothetical protein